MISALQGTCRVAREGPVFLLGGRPACGLGFVKPTMLVENGLKLNEAMWADCQKRLGTSQARDEYGPLLDRFIEYSLNEKGTHVSEVAKRIRLALAAGRPLHGYKVGPDSRATPVAGLLPVPVADAVMKFSVFGRQGAF